MAGNVFQLTVLSQDDQGCGEGSELTVTVTGFTGGTLTSGPINAGGSFPINQPVPLPTPHDQGEPPTWFLDLSGTIKEASYTLTIEGPGTSNPTTITVDGAQMPYWVEQNKKEDTNQIYKEGKCGIFGYAQLNEPSGQPKFWIYTVTAGVFHPKVHPNG